MRGSSTRAHFFMRNFERCTLTLKKNHLNSALHKLREDCGSSKHVVINELKQKAKCNYFKKTTIFLVSDHFSVYRLFWPIVVTKMYCCRNDRVACKAVYRYFYFLAPSCRNYIRYTSGILTEPSYTTRKLASLKAEAYTCGTQSNYLWLESNSIIKE